MLEQAIMAVKLARGLIDDVEFSLEDASRTEFDFMCLTEQVINAVLHHQFARHCGLFRSGRIWRYDKAFN